MKCGMALSQAEEKKAVEAGYWQLYRYNPEKVGTEENAFTLDSKAPKGDFRAFLMGQNRYASLKLAFPDKAEAFYEKAEADAKKRLALYEILAGL